MTILQQFVGTVYALVVAGRWSDLTEYFSLFREAASRPTAIITAGKPQDKEIKK